MFRGIFLARMRERALHGEARGLRQRSAVRGVEAGQLRGQGLGGAPSRRWRSRGSVEYLAPTHRVAIGNSRLVKLGRRAGDVRVQDYADAAKTKSMTLDRVEVPARWVSHVLRVGS